MLQSKSKAAQTQALGPRKIRTLNLVEEYLLSPPNLLSVKLVHQNNPSRHTDARYGIYLSFHIVFYLFFLIFLFFSKPTPYSNGRLDLLIEGVDLKFTISKVQFDQMLSTLGMIVTLGRQKLIALHRPIRSVTLDPKAWWKYAFHIVSGRPFFHR